MSLDSAVMVTKLQVTRFLKLASGDSDDVLDDIINGVWSELETFCGRTFKQATYTDETYDGTGTPDLLLANLPVVSVSSLVKEEDGDALVEGTDFVIRDANAGLISLLDGYVFPESIQEVVVTYQAGYTTLPLDLQLAVLEACAFVYKRFSSGAWGIRSQAIGTERGLEFAAETLPKSVLTVWGRYAKLLFEDV